MGEEARAKGNGDVPIAANDLHKAFGEQKVLNGITFRIGRGETAAVLGRSGTGKSVLLKLLIGLQTPDSGSIRLFGQEIAGLDENGWNEIRKQMGFLFQQAALYDSMTVEQNVAFPLARHVKMPESERKEKVRELLASVGMESHLDKLPSQISGGMQKRVGLARALALEPQIVLFDEPTAGLDPITSMEIGKLILELKEKRNITAMVVTHDVPTAKLFSDRVLLLHEGNIRAEGTFEDLQKNQDEFVSQFLGEGS